MVELKVWLIPVEYSGRKRSYFMEMPCEADCCLCAQKKARKWAADRIGKTMQDTDGRDFKCESVTVRMDLYREPATTPVESPEGAKER